MTQSYKKTETNACLIIYLSVTCKSGHKQCVTAVYTAKYRLIGETIRMLPFVIDYFSSEIIFLYFE